jgi:choline-glycine betaine transporter
VAGISANLGVGILSISSGLENTFGVDRSPALLIFIVGTIVCTFILSSISGVQNGIRKLSNWNLRGFILLFLIVLWYSPITTLMELGWQGMQEYIVTFVERSINFSSTLKEEWRQNWTTFYWANWLAWAPVTCLFLGYLGRGYSIRTLIRFNLLYPALFSILWMTVFGAFSLHLDLSGPDFPMKKALDGGGPEKMIYTIFSQLPNPRMLVILFLALAFLSFVTAADSATSAMSNISYKGMSSSQEEAPVRIKILWGVVVGMIAVIMILLAGIDGVRMISNLGGLPALFIFIIVALSFCRMIFDSFLEKMF